MARSKVKREFWRGGWRDQPGVAAATAWTRNCFRDPVTTHNFCVISIATGQLKTANTILWIGLAAMVAITVGANLTVGRVADSVGWVEHSHAVITELDRLSWSVDLAQKARRGFALSGEAGELSAYEAARNRALGIADTLRALTADNPDQQARLQLLEPRLVEAARMLDSSVQARKERGFDVAHEAVSVQAMQPRIDAFRPTVDALMRNEIALLAQREARLAEYVERSRRIYYAGLATSLLMVLAGATGLRTASARALESDRTARASEQRLAVTLASIGDGVVVTDLQGNITQMNRVAEKLTGWTLDEASGSPLEAVVRIVSEHTRQPIERSVKRVLTDNTEATHAQKAVLLSRNSDEYFVEARAARVQSRDGRISGVVLVLRKMDE